MTIAEPELHPGLDWQDDVYRVLKEHDIRVCMQNNYFPTHVDDRRSIVIGQ